MERLNEGLIVYGAAPCKPQPKSDGAVCRELWAAIESRPPLRVGSVIVSSRRYRWACLVVVPWSRYAMEVDCREDLDKLFAELDAFELEQAAEVVEVVEVNQLTSNVAAPVVEPAAVEQPIAVAQMELF